MLHLIGKFEGDYHQCHVCGLICRVYITSAFQCEKIKLREGIEIKLEKIEKERGKWIKRRCPFALSYLAQIM